MQSNSTDHPTAKTVQPCVHCRRRKGYQSGGLCAKCYRTPGVREEHETSKRCEHIEVTCPHCGSARSVRPCEARNPFCNKSCATTFHNYARHGTDADRFWRFVDKSSECWVWTGHRIRGYGQFSIDTLPVKAHRFSWELHFGKIPTGLMVCHHCDNPPCIRPDHLFLGTALDNVHDMIRKGRKKITRRTPTSPAPS